VLCTYFITLFFDVRHIVNYGICKITYGFIKSNGKRIAENTPFFCFSFIARFQAILYGILNCSITIERY
jgi:hypothetical protein